MLALGWARQGRAGQGRVSAQWQRQPAAQHPVRAGLCVANNLAPATPASDTSAQFIEDETLAATLARKLAPPLVTLLGAEPELQYVALRNINLIISAKPGVLANDVKV